MTLTDEQKAIAKVQAQGCRRWMSWIILAPVLLCAILTLIAPSVQDSLVKREANQQCQSLPTLSEPVANSTIYDDSVVGTSLISVDNFQQISLIDTITLESAIPSRSHISAIAHPNGDYVIYVAYRPSEATNIFICEGGEALGAFSADESAGDVVFNQAGTLFALSDGLNERVVVFDGVNIERLESISIAGVDQIRHIHSIAFHPTEPLLFFTSDDELFVFETETFSRVLQRQFSATSQQEIGFNAEGTILYISQAEDDTQADAWGIAE